MLTVYFWLLFAVREAKLSLKRLKTLVVGEKPKKREPLPSGGTASGGSAGGTGAKTGGAQDVQATAAAESPEGKKRPAGQGRQGADV